MARSHCLSRSSPGELRLRVFAEVTRHPSALPAPLHPLPSPHRSAPVVCASVPARPPAVACVTLRLSVHTAVPGTSPSTPLPACLHTGKPERGQTWVLTLAACRRPLSGRLLLSPTFCATAVTALTTRRSGRGSRPPRGHLCASASPRSPWGPVLGPRTALHPGWGREEGGERGSGGELGGPSPPAPTARPGGTTAPSTRTAAAFLPRRPEGTVLGEAAPPCPPGSAGTQQGPRLGLRGPRGQTCPWDRGGGSGSCVGGQAGPERLQRAPRPRDRQAQDVRSVQRLLGGQVVHVGGVTGGGHGGDAGVACEVSGWVATPAVDVVKKCPPFLASVWGRRTPVGLPQHRRRKDVLVGSLSVTSDPRRQSHVQKPDFT